jgi:hypothetical protein
MIAAFGSGRPWIAIFVFCCLPVKLIYAWTEYQGMGFVNVRILTLVEIAAVVISFFL